MLADVNDCQQHTPRFDVLQQVNKMKLVRAASTQSSANLLIPHSEML